MTIFLKPLILASALMFAGLCACAQYEKPVHPVQMVEQTHISGEAGYRERIALPPNAYAIVNLSDISRADAPSVTLSEQRLDLDGKSVPFAYSILVPSMRLHEGLSYAVRIEIHSKDGALLWTTDQVHRIDPVQKEQTLDPILLKKI